MAQKTLWYHLNKAGCNKKLDVLVSHKLTQKTQFHKRMVIGDENWDTYNNVKRKRSKSNRREKA